MFQFPAFAPAFAGDRPSACRVAPFGYLRIFTRLQFPGAFRSCPRPSSPPEAQASSVRPYCIPLCSGATVRTVSGPSVPPIFFAGTAASRPRTCLFFFSLTSLSVPSIVKQLPAPSRPRLRRIFLKIPGSFPRNLFLFVFPPAPSRLQKGGVPATPSGTATLLRLSPSHRSCPWPFLTVADFRHSRLPWLDGRCVQGPGTYSPRHG